MLNIVEVRQGARSPDLAGMVEQPHVGWRTDGHALTVSGWALGLEGAVVAVEVVAGDVVLRSTSANLPRPDVGGVPEFCGIEGAGLSGFATDVGLLGIPEAFSLDVRAVFADQRRELLAQLRGSRQPLSARGPLALRPVLVTCLARSGTTLLMEVLESHPDVVVEPTYPYETRCATYWMHMLKVMGEPGGVVPPIVWYPRFADLEKSWPNPFNSFESQQEGDWFRSGYIERMISFCCGSLDDFYRVVGRAQRKFNPACFAEKQFPGPIANVIDEVYPDRTELISVRDPRDMLISWFGFMARGHTVLGHSGSDDPGTVVEEFTSELRLLLERRDRLGDRALVVRYEDLISPESSTFRDLLRYAHLPSPPEVIENMRERTRNVSARSRAHQTSDSPARSVARWRQEFDDRIGRHWSQQLEDMTVALGYPPTRTPGTSKARGHREARRSVEPRRPHEALAAAQGEHSPLQDELGAVRAERATVESDLGNVQEELSTVGSELSTVERELGTLQARWDSVERRRTVRLFRRLQRLNRSVRGRSAPDPSSHTPRAVQDPSRLEISTDISPNDEMYAGNAAHYMGCGRSALRCIQNALVLAGADEPKRILDLPCGHGRVLRALRARFRAAEITACDLNTDGVDYCARSFDAIPAYSVDDPSEIPLSGPYDLIWSGSLLTHLPMRRWDGFLGLFERLLAPGGVAVFTTHGRTTEAWLRRGETDAGFSMEQQYGLTEPQVADLLEGLAEHGFGYVDYPNQIEYGISVASRHFVIGRVEQLTRLRVAACLEHAWDRHQDVFVCVKP